MKPTAVLITLSIFLCSSTCAPPPTQKGSDFFLTPQRARLGQYKFMAIIRKEFVNKAKPVKTICIGVIISSSWILSSAKCMSAPYFSSFTIETGAVEDYPDSSHIVKVHRVIKHPKYKDLAHGYDVALLIPRSSLRFGDSVNSISISKAPPGNMSLVIGLRLFKCPHCHQHPLLHAVYLNATAKLGDFCVPSHETEICSDNPIFKASFCKEVSKGPLINNRGGKLELVGFTSRLYGDTCHGSVIFTSMANPQIVDFIEKNSGVKVQQ